MRGFWVSLPASGRAFLALSLLQALLAGAYAATQVRGAAWLLSD